MRVLIDATAARDGGALTDFAAILPELDRRLAASDDARVLADENLIKYFGSSEMKLSFEGRPVGSGVSRLKWIFRGMPTATREYGADVLLAGQFVTGQPKVPYLLRLTEPGLVDPAYSRSLTHLSPKERLGVTVKKRMFRRSAKSAHSIICATNAIADCLLSRIPDVPKNRIIVSPFGLSPIVAGVKARHKFNGTRRLLTMHATAHKNIEVILEALATPQMKEYSLSIMADLSHPATKYQQYLATRIKEMGLGSRVKSLGFLRSNEAVVKQMLEHDALIVPSITETWSHGVIEGMALGMPVIASDIPCHREVSAGAAWLTPTDNPVALSEVVAKLESEDDERRRRLELGLEIVSKLSWGRHASDIVDSLRDAVA
jgi:glycosyltransferase involved in cell wall biosynthesis